MSASWSVTGLRVRERSSGEIKPLFVLADNADHSPDYLAKVRAPNSGYLSTPFAYTAACYDASTGSGRPACFSSSPGGSRHASFGLKRASDPYDFVKMNTKLCGFLPECARGTTCAHLRTTHR